MASSSSSGKLRPKQGLITQVIKKIFLECLLCAGQGFSSGQCPQRQTSGGGDPSPRGIGHEVKAQTDNKTVTEAGTVPGRGNGIPQS